MGVQENFKTKYLTTKDVRSILGFSENKTYAIINRPDFPKMKIGRQYLIPEDKFYEYMDSKCYSIVTVQ